MINILDSNPIMITWITIIAIIAVLLIIFLIIVFTKKHNKLINEQNKQNKKLNISDESFFKLLGGKDNIINFKLVGSRLTLELKDIKIVDKEGLKAAKFEGIIEMQNKIVLVKEDLSQELRALDELKIN